MTPETLSTILPRCKQPEMWAELMTEILPQYEIDSPERIASFLAQCGHESMHFNVLEENLNYSADGLLKIFGKYFPTRELANQYARKPEKIANRVYANRMKNGPEGSGDGWKYRGRGAIQCTGKANYEQLSNDLFGDDTLLVSPDILLHPRNALLSACWYWDKVRLNEHAHDVVKTTRLVNGGTHGLNDRTAIYEKALSVLSE